MTYDVLKDYENKERKITLHVGDKFIPAETHFPQNLTDTLVLNGTLKLIEKEKPIEKPVGVLSFSPASGPEGTTVTVNGVADVLGVSKVTLSGVDVSHFISERPDSLTFTVPLAATTGVIVVSTPDRSQTSEDSFTVTHGPAV
jgi:hypothetical protein